MRSGAWQGRGEIASKLRWFSKWVGLRMESKCVGSKRRGGFNMRSGFRWRQDGWVEMNWALMVLVKVRLRIKLLSAVDVGKKKKERNLV